MLDVTHGFRSRPSLPPPSPPSSAPSIVNRHRFGYSTPRSRRGQDGVTPVWDLTPLFELVDWTQA